jgi:hypothetical protein
MYLKIKIHHDAEEEKENTVQGFSKTSFKNSFIRTWSIGSDLCQQKLRYKYNLMM